MYRLLFAFGSLPVKDEGKVKVVSPLEHVIEPDFLQFIVKPRCWTIIEDVTILLPGYDFQRVIGKHFQTEPGKIVAFKGYKWDGASGLAADTPDVWISSLAHDIACTKAGDEFVLPGYFQRHSMYAHIMWEQRPRPIKDGGFWSFLNCLRKPLSAANVLIQFVCLISFNWLWRSTPLNDTLD